MRNIDILKRNKELKQNGSQVFAEVGMNTSVAFNMFARAVLRDNRLPFDVTTESDPFYCDNNLAHLRRGVAALNAGNGVEHDIIEVSE